MGILEKVNAGVSPFISHNVSSTGISANVEIKNLNLNLNLNVRGTYYHSWNSGWQGLGMA